MNRIISQRFEQRRKERNEKKASLLIIPSLKLGLYLSLIKYLSWYSIVPISLHSQEKSNSRQNKDFKPEAIHRPNVRHKLYLIL